MEVSRHFGSVVLRSEYLLVTGLRVVHVHGRAVAERALPLLVGEQQVVEAARVEPADGVEERLRQNGHARAPRGREGPHVDLSVLGHVAGQLQGEAQEVRASGEAVLGIVPAGLNHKLHF